MKTKRDILIEVHDNFLDRQVRQSFDARLYKETPDEEKKLEANAIKAKQDLDGLQSLQKVQAGKVRVVTIEKAEAKLRQTQNAFIIVRYARLVKLVEKMIKEEEK